MIPGPSCKIPGIKTVHWPTFHVFRVAAFIRTVIRTAFFSRGAFGGPWPARDAFVRVREKLETTPHSISTPSTMQ